MADARPPVLVIGMHRSGTSLVTRMLEALGLFAGADLEANHESRWFIGRNEDVLRLAGATWDCPAPIDALLADPARRARAAGRLRRAMRSPARVRYTGLRSLAGRPWGWKDPRTTLTAPLWLDLFPEARVVHVVRHGVDVAASLVHRNHTEAPRRRRRPTSTPFARGSRRGTLEHGLSLWEDYVRRGREVVHAREGLGVEVRYEELLHAPRPVLEGLAVFAGLAPDAVRLGRAAAMADPTGRFRHLRRDELAAFAAAARGRLEVHGYA